ncbi:hypothetical protein C8Q78DRAFT_963409 [Trametes maxima]|nr:hypothetical protein C8Q78DRAFT_963409 [Trametes maxima]
MVVTSPNMDWVPELPIEKSTIETFEDGRWGVREYSCWPQMLIPDMLHLACILAPGTSTHSMLWEDLDPHTHWAEDETTGVPGLGYIIPDVRNSLADAANTTLLVASLSSSEAPVDVRARSHLLTMILKQARDRMLQLPATAWVAIAVAAHVQHITLELRGMLTYVRNVLPRISSGADQPSFPLDVVGTFVKDATDAQLCTRLRIPTWYLQPLTNHLRVWQVVDVRRPTWRGSSRSSDPPILHQPGVVARVSNLSMNWATAMALTVGRSVCQSRMAVMTIQRNGRNGRILAKGPGVREVEAAQTSNSTSGQPLREAAELHPPGPSLHPSRSWTSSPFYSVPESWARALRSVSPVPQPVSSVAYFYPPPFLLDTKVHRYLHNMVRIRKFCRTRLFDPTMTSHPLTISEWRAALWGDYAVQSEPAHAKKESDQRRAQKRQDLRNSVSRLLGRTALLPSYSPTLVADLEGKPVSASVAVSDPQVRARLLWEAHETNFRCEVMALDTVIMHRPDWHEVDRWDRESLVSGIWGEPSSVVSVIPPPDTASVAFCWFTPPDAQWWDARAFLARFVGVLKRWPDPPQSIMDLNLEDDSLRPEEFSRAQDLVVQFYVQTFVSHFSHLPIPPIAFPTFT